MLWSALNVLFISWDSLGVPPPVHRRLDLIYVYILEMRKHKHLLLSSYHSRASSVHRYKYVYVYVYMYSRDRSYSWVYTRVMRDQVASMIRRACFNRGRRCKFLHSETICFMPLATWSIEVTVAPASWHAPFGRKRGEWLSRPALLDRDQPKESILS